MASAFASSSSSILCYNPDCKEFKSQRPKKGWKLGSGGRAELCDRCGNAFEEGRFCETFHLNASGWRNCETCRKGIHCGCIVSDNSFMLLDTGGIKCSDCATEHTVLSSIRPWPQTFSFQNHLSQRLGDLSTRSWNQLAGSGPVPWNQAPSLFNSVSSPDWLLSSLEKKNENPSGISNGSVKLGSCEIMHANGMRKASTCFNICQQTPSLKENSSSQPFGFSVPYASPNERNGQLGVIGNHSQQNLLPPPGKQFGDTVHIALDSLGGTHIHNGWPQVDAQGKNQLLPRYWPRCTDQELQQISIDSDSVITPLFHKTLSASDAGRIGRLVLPKKCAEAYFPPIYEPEGLPLKILDAKGKEWILQFRFWPNNNSRMYVLEGVTPCIQSMQLQAGDTVTFGRLEPEGRLVMGYRKASSTTPSDQDNGAKKTGNGFPLLGEVEVADPSSWSKANKSGYVVKEVLGSKPSISKKRKSSSLGSKNKCLRIKNEDLIELRITWQEAQGMFRPPPNLVPSIVVIDGFEFEEYEDGPVLGKPTFFTTDDVGEKVQWAQCEYCLKWRKLPANALLPSKWTCSDNSWDLERSSCSAPQELTAEEIENFLPSCDSAVSKTIKPAKKNPDKVEALEVLDTLANLTITGEGEELLLSSQATTKHPRHRPGCSCIVCIQPPSGKGPKHEQTCTCNVCSTVKRRFRTVMLRREKKQSEREAKIAQKQQQPLPSSEMLIDGESLACTNMGENSPNQNREGSDGSEGNDSSDDNPNPTKSSALTFKCQIDLNMKPEREDDESPRFDSGTSEKLFHYMLNSGATDSSSSQSKRFGD